MRKGGLYAAALLGGVLGVACGAARPCPGVAAGASQPAPATLTPAPAPAEVAPAPRFPEIAREMAETRSWTQGDPRSFEVLRDGRAVLFLRGKGRGRAQDLWAFDVQSGATRLVASAATLLGGAEDRLSAEEKARRERQGIMNTGIAWFTASRDGRQALVALGGTLHVLDVASGRGRRLQGTAGATDARFSPDGRYASFVRDHDLHACELATGRVFAVTRGGTEAVSHAEAEFVAQEEMERFTGYWWAPDSTRVLYEEADQRAVERRFIGEPSAPRQPPQPWAYPRPGTPNAKVRLGLMRVGGGPTTWVEWDRARYPYLAAVTWEEGAPPAILVQARDQREEVLLAVDPASGRTRALLRERDEAWINLNPRLPRWLSGGRELLWTTEADGEWRLVVHGADGTRRRVLNPGGGFRLHEVLHVDEARGVVVVAGSDRPPEQHIYELPLAGGAARRLTTAPGVHTRWYGKRSAVHVARHVHATGKGPFQVVRADGSVAGTIESRAVAPPFAPRVELVRVGPLGFEAAIVRPRDFQPGRRYPVVHYVYAGPGVQVVAADALYFMRPQWYADQGFIVVMADGRGTPNRGRAWERAIRGDLAAVPLEDQVAALRALGARYPELDLGRVAIMGWSFGGYMAALGVARRGDVWHAAVVGAPVSDWHEYDTHYTERYLGLPAENPAGYRSGSVLAHAAGIKRPLLIVHGTADDNVYFDHSLRLIDVLYKAGVPFEFLPLVGHTHLPNDPAVLAQEHLRIAAFLRRQLGGPR
jgi:dipeptidyl-peptidase 4